MKNLVLIVLMCVPVMPATLLAQQPSAHPDDADAPILTLDEALSIAMSENRVVKDSVYEAEKSGLRVSSARTRRLPQFQFSVLSGQLLHSIDYTFPAGAFGYYPDIGAVPATEAKVRTPSQFTTYATASVDFPVIQQHEIGLGIRVNELGSDIAREGVRVQRQKIAADVRTAYFNLVAAQAAVDAGRQAVTTMEEAQRVTTEYRAQQIVLRADALEVDSRLARSRYELSVANNALATQRERLNELLGRELTTVFRVHALPGQDASKTTIEAVRQQALDNRPEIRQADLKASQADYDRRLAKAEYLPDLSLSVRYMGFNNFEVIPANVTIAGLFLTWEPFDWGRRKSNVAEKVVAVTQARNGAQETRAQIALEAGTKYRKWQEARLLLAAARTSREAAVEQFRVTTNRYKEQAALIRDLLQAQARSTDADYQYQQALSSFWSAFADLRRAMGEE